MSTWSVIADIDTALLAFDPDNNVGTAAQLSVTIILIGDEKTVRTRGMLNFDLTGFPGASGDITSAKLTLDVVGVGGNPDYSVDFRRVTDHPDTWVELEATWNDYKTATPWNTAGGVSTTVDEVTFQIPGSNGLYDIPGFEALVVDAIDNRSDLLALQVRQDNEAEEGTSRTFNFRSINALSGTKPTLEITYGAIARPPDYRRRRMTV